MLKDIKGFSLIELSIVILIIGVVVASIAAGDTLVRNSQLQSVIVDLQGFKASYDEFGLKYQAVPGDMSNALSYWPADGQCLATVSGNEGVCNGNGDSLIQVGCDPVSDEVNKALKHLSLAGMINTAIPVISTTLVPLVVGVTAPASRISGAGYFYASIWGCGALSTSVVDATINLIVLGKPSTDPSYTTLMNSALTPVDAFTIDQKIDDAVLLSQNSLLDNFIASAFAAKIGGGGGGGGCGGGGGGLGIGGKGGGNCPPPPPPVYSKASGASTGKIRVQPGIESATNNCTENMANGDTGYNLTITVDACTLEFSMRN
ncbi:MAG: prepilin-type N-terminal cleavage/methylation domain-containing protein [Rickettsiales bacterium]